MVSATLEGSAVRGVWRLALVIVVAVVACGWAIVALQDDDVAAVSGCGSAVPTVPGYTATVQTEPDPPQAAGTQVLVLVERAGRPVRGADVCLSVDMAGMPMGGDTRYEGQQLSAGRYSIFPSFGMPGSWTGNLVVSVAGRPVLSRQVSFQVV